MATSAIRAHQPVQVFEMMERLGIEPSSSVTPRLSLTYATAVHRCEVCPYHETCRYWLDHAPALVGSAPRFCPDADILFELQFDQIRPSSATTSKSFGLSKNGYLQP
jgi:hypothetical protein